MNSTMEKTPNLKPFFFKENIQTEIFKFDFLLF